MLEDAIEVAREFMSQDVDETNYAFLMRFLEEFEELTHEVSFVKAKLEEEYLIGLSITESLDIF